MVYGLLRFARNDEGVAVRGLWIAFCSQLQKGGQVVVYGLLRSARNDEE